MVVRAKLHVANNHAGLLPDQVTELRQVQDRVITILQDAAGILLDRKRLELWDGATALSRLKQLTHRFDRNQVQRIQDDSSKTRPAAATGQGGLTA